MNQIMDAIFRMMVVPNCANCEFKDRQKAEMIVDFNLEKKEMKDEFNRNLDDFKKSIRKEFTEEIAMLKEVCLHPKLEMGGKWNPDKGPYGLWYIPPNWKYTSELLDKYKVFVIKKKM